MHTVEFADIRIRAALPLHAYLFNHPHLFLRLLADGSVCGDTARVDGDLASGVWEFNARLYAPRVKQSLNITVLTGVKGPGIPVVSVTLKVAELLAREKACSNRHQYIVIFDSRAAIQLKLVMMCSIKLSPISSRVSHAVHAKDQTINRCSRRYESSFDPETMQLLSREDLESLYVKTSYMPDHDYSKARRLCLLGCRFHALYDEEYGKADLERAISIHEEAIHCTRLFHLDTAEHAHRLSMALMSCFQESGVIVDIERAISYLNAALNFTEDLDADKSNRLSHLGLAFHLRFQRLGDLTDLEAALSTLRTAVQLTPDGRADKPASLTNLGNVLDSRFSHLGDLADLEDAILTKKKAVELMPDGHPLCLSNLGAALQARFDHLGGLADLEDAISSLQKAIHLAPDGHPSKPGLLNNFGNALESRFKRLGGLPDLEDAISSRRKAIEQTPDDHPAKPSRLNNLGNALQARYERLGVLTDLEGAILNRQKAVEFTPDGHPDKPGRLSNLGNALQSRFERLGSVADLEDSLSNKRQAIKLAPNEHPNNSTLFNNLGSTFSSRFRCLGILSDLESALSAFSTAANFTSGSAMMRFNSARSWAKVAEENSRSPLDAFSCAIDLLPRIAWLGLAVSDQHALLADVGGIVREAVAAAIRYKEYETAVVWAEQGRSIVWQNLLGLRNPVEDLQAAHPELAKRLKSIAGQLEGSNSYEPLGVTGQTASADDVSRKHSKLAREWENVIHEIRSMPNFRGFLKSKSFGQLAAAAHEGPVVILNVNNSQCDALVLIADKSTKRHISVVNIPLERFSHEKSTRMFQNLTELLSSAGVRERNDRKTGRARTPAHSDAKFKVILHLLWEDVVKPVIEGLAFQTESKRLPRIWWCATGLLAFLPIHAAGLYDTQEVGKKVTDYVVSSYTPTLTAILELSDPVVREDFQVLTVAQPSTPGAQPIPKTEEEVQMIQCLAAGARVLNLTRENATVERVREGMMESNWIHLACHGQQNTTEPMKSGFLLHDRTLELSEIVKMSLPKAEFAFLSACQTAMGDPKVTEESVHLAAGMFLSGCNAVIATTWSIRDDDAPKIVQEFYSRMFKDGSPNRKEAAYALHEAVKLLRESGAPCTSWVPFIHIGR